jgi:hypothetical protein
MRGRQVASFIAVLAAACSCELRFAAHGLEEGVGRDGDSRTLYVTPQSQPSANSRFQIDLKRSGFGDDSFEVHGLNPLELSRLAAARFTSDQWSALFAVHVKNEKAAPHGSRPSLLGDYETGGGVLRFTPRFPLQPGLRYLAVFDPARLPGKEATGRSLVVEKEFFLPKAPAVATTVVEDVFPTRRTLPENLLKFYLHFSAPMQRGEVYQYIRLLDSSKQAVDLPFLELDEELWDPEGRRFTLLFDPGRIKRGNRPREEVGPSLEQGKSYTLLIDRRWLDAAGNPLKESYQKTFTVGPPDETQPSPESYRISPPPAGSQTALVLTFPESLDHAMLERVITVIDAADNRLRGRISIEAEETRWRFVPDNAWKEGRYQIVLDTTLEDLAGNSIGRPFEIDLFHPIERRVLSQTVALPFVVK